MKNRRRLVLWLSLTALVVPLTFAVIFTHGMVIEIKASAATPPLLPDAEELAPNLTVRLPIAGDVLVNGGMGAGRAHFKTIAKAEYYDPAKRAFFTTGTMPVTAADQTALAVSSSPGSKIAAFGGISGKVHATINLLSFMGTVMGSVETYDPTTGRWTAGANMMSSPRTGATATLLPSGKILIAGGFSNNDSSGGTVALNTAIVPARIASDWNARFLFSASFGGSSTSGRSGFGAGGVTGSAGEDTCAGELSVWSIAGELNCDRAGMAIWGNMGSVALGIA